MERVLLLGLLAGLLLAGCQSSNKVYDCQVKKQQEFIQDTGKQPTTEQMATITQYCLDQEKK